jgi:[ribosomal protein S5]-alanine N-acetyltransferase
MMLSGYRFPDELQVDELLIRPPIEADIEMIAPSFVDPAVGGEAGLPPVGPEALRAALDHQLPQWRAQGLMAAYVIEEDGTLPGGTTLHHFDPMRDTVEIGYWLVVEARGRGIATRAVGAMVDHAFEHGILRVEAHVRPENSASARVLERLGFEREGTKRKLLRHGGRRVDAHLFARVSDSC